MQVRILNNSTRDAQQSNLSAEMADEHRQAMSALINDVYKSIQGEPRHPPLLMLSATNHACRACNPGVPGYEQTWGGTVPMFDLWKRGVHPFDGKFARYTFVYATRPTI